MSRSRSVVAARITGVEPESRDPHEPFDPPGVEREASGEPVGLPLHGRGPEGADMVREALAQVLQELVEQIQVGETLAGVQDQMGALGERSARAELASSQLADPLRVTSRAEAFERLFECGQVDAEP